MKKKTKIILISLTVLAASIFLLSRFYLTIYTDVWKEENAAVQTAREKAGVVEVADVDLFTGDKPYTIVTGKTEDGRSVVVWVNENESHTESADAGISKTTAKNSTLLRRPEAEVMRVTPGKYEDQYVWQVFYQVKEGSRKNFYYDYYRFSDGELLDTWSLSLQR